MPSEPRKCLSVRTPVCLSPADNWSKVMWEFDRCENGGGRNPACHRPHWSFSRRQRLLGSRRRRVWGVLCLRVRFATSAKEVGSAIPNQTIFGEQLRLLGSITASSQQISASDSLASTAASGPAHTHTHMDMSVISNTSNKQALSHAAETEPLDATVCEYTLRKVLSWLEVPELLGSAALVSQRWAAAAGCKEVFRRRMHRHVLETLFNLQHSTRQQQQQQQKDEDASNTTASHNDNDASSSTTTTTAAADDQHQEQEQEDQEQEQEQDPTAAAVAAVWRACLSPARLFAGLYAPNLLANGSFLERLNCHKGPQRRLVWEPTFNPRGTTWAHPFDFFPELCPLPEEQGGSHKPFSIGCLAAAGSAWSEVTQVLDLQAALTAAGLPGPTASWLITAGLTLEFSVLVAGGSAAGGEYQVVLSLITAADAEAATTNELPLSAVPKMTLPFGHPPASCPGIEAVSAAQMAARGFTRGSRNVAKAPLHPPPGIWTRYRCRVELPRDSTVSHVAVALRGRATRNSRLGHYATKFADAGLRFLPADES